MQVELGQLSMEGMNLELPPQVADGVSLPARTASLREAKALRGTLTTDDAGVRLRGVAATELVVASLAWHFGSKTFLSWERPARAGGVRAEIASGQALDLDVELATLQAERLLLRAGALTLAAEVDALGVALAVHGDDVGTLTAEQALFRDVELRTGDVVLTMPELRVRKLNVDWGGERFKLEAATAEGETLRVALEGGQITANDVALAAFKLHGEDYQLGEARFGKLAVDATLSRGEGSSGGAESAPAKQGPALFDYALLDGLSGHVNVDLHVDIALPIIQHRRATHELRIPIDEGAIDYRKLESNLAPLEDSLIDFSVRDGALVLELGLPLIRTRGHGKPIVRWNLSAADLALAEEHRVRLAVLPNARGASASEAPKPEPKPANDEKESSVRLRSLSLENLDAVLQVAPEQSKSAALRALSLGELQLAGSVHHDPEGEPREGTVRGSVRELRAAVQGVPVGKSALRGELSLGASRSLTVRFLDLKPQQVQAELEQLTLKDVALGDPRQAAAVAQTTAAQSTYASARPS